MHETDVNEIVKRGEAFLNAGEYDRALDQFMHAVELDEQNTNTHHSLGLPVQRWQVSVRALADVTTPMLYARSDEWGNMGDCCFMARRYAEAIQCYTRVLAAAREDDWETRLRAHEWRAYARYQTRDFEGVIADLTIKMEQGAKPNAALYHTRGCAYHASKQMELAYSDWCHAIRLNPDEPHSYRCRAHWYEDHKRFAEALSDWNAILRLSPPDAYKFARRAWVYQKLHRHDEAVADLGAALALDPNYGYAHYLLGHIAEDYDTKEALHHYNEAIRHEPNKVSYFQRRGNMYMRRARVLSAIRDWERAHDEPDWYDKLPKPVRYVLFGPLCLFFLSLLCVFWLIQPGIVWYRRRKLAEARKRRAS